MNFAVSGSAVPAAEEVVLSLDATTGATVQGALSISGSCTVGGQLVVSGTNVLDALTQYASSTVVDVSGVTGLTDALAAKQSVIGPESSLELESLQCSLIKAKVDSIAGGSQSLKLSY